MKKEIDISGKLLSSMIYPEFFVIQSNENVLNVGCGNGVQAVVYKDSYKEMIGVDISSERLTMVKEVVEKYGVTNFKVIQANVEQIPLEEKFDKVIAIDIIEHVMNPSIVAREIHRLLKDGGSVLITFPAMHDKWENLFRFIGRKILWRKSKTVRKDGWDPDEHQYDYNLKEWKDIMEKAGFHLEKSRASTMFPPLHYLGIPKFWFSNKLIRAIDGFICRQPFCENYGQALICVYKKVHKQ